MKKNCINCEHIEYIESEEWDSKGNICNKREYKNNNEENKHLELLTNFSYLFKSKRCFEKRLQK